MMIELKQISKQYPGGFDALQPIDFAIEKGEMLFLTGHSGAGKSTLLRLIALIEQPTAGDMLIEGRSVKSFKKHDIATYRLNLGITLQTPHLLTDRSVFANVALPLQIQGMQSTIITKRVHSALDRVGLLNKATMLPVQLSGGEQQRVGIARALVHKPALILADEPTGNLDPALSKDIMGLFEQLNDAGVAIIVATHDLALIANMTHRIVLLKQGQICHTA